MTFPRAFALLALLTCSFVSARVHAQGPSRRVQESPFSLNTQLKLGGAALGGAVLGATVAGVVGATTYYLLADCGACDGEDDEFDRDVLTITTTSLSAALFIPGATVLSTRRTGTQLGHPGRLRWLFGGAYIGLGIGVVSTVFLAEVLPEPSFWPLFVGGATVAVVGVAGMTTLFHRISARRDLQLHPIAAPTAHGFSAGIAGRF